MGWTKQKTQNYELDTVTKFEWIALQKITLKYLTASSAYLPNRPIYLEYLQEKLSLGVHSLWVYAMHNNADGIYFAYS